MRHLLVFAVLLLPVAAWPGPWPREQGTGFVSLSSEYFVARGAEQAYTSFYAEYGLSDQLTLGADLGGNDSSGDWTAFVFARRPVLQGKGPHQVALELGLGAAPNPLWQAEPVLRPGLHWGRGLKTGWGPGWVTLETRLEYRVLSQDSVRKADLTLGVRPRDHTMLIMQVQSGDYPASEPYLRLAPKYVRRIGRSKAHLEVGLRYGVSSDDSLGVRIGSWLNF